MKDFLVCGHFCGSPPCARTAHSVVVSAHSHKRWSIALLSLDIWCRQRLPSLTGDWCFCWYLTSTFLLHLLPVWATSLSFIGHYLFSSWRHFLLPFLFGKPPSQKALKQHFLQINKTAKANKNSLSAGSRHISPKVLSTACQSTNICEKLQKPQHE